MKASKPRAFIIRLASVNDLIELILKLKLPNEKTPIIKSNRDYRVFAKSEFHASKSVIGLVNPGSIEKIFALNPKPKKNDRSNRPSSNESLRAKTGRSILYEKRERGVPELPNISAGSPGPSKSTTA